MHLTDPSQNEIGRDKNIKTYYFAKVNIFIQELRFKDGI